MRAYFAYFAFIGFIVMARAQAPDFRHYTVNNGLASGIVYHSMQDSKGYMWFCTESGVNRFDGKTFETFTIKDGLADNDNFRCIEDQKGRIWFSSYNGKLSYFQNGSFINEHSDPSLRDADSSHRFINGMLCDRQGTIWYSKFGEENARHYMHGQLLEKVVPGFDKKYAGYNVRLFMEYRDTASILDFSGDRLVRMNLGSGRMHPVHYPIIAEWQSVSRPYTQSLPDGSQYFITDAGLCLFRNDSAHIVLRHDALGLEKGVSLRTFRIVKGDLWIGTNRGLFVVREFESKGFQGLQAHYPGEAIISYIIEDREGGIWVNTLSEGCFYLPVSRSYLTNVPIKSVTAIRHSGKGHEYGVGTYDGNVMLMSGDRLAQQHVFSVSSSPHRIKGIKWLSQERVLLGSDLGLYLYSVKDGRIIDTLKDLDRTTSFSDMDEGEEKSWIINRTVISLLDQDKLIPLYSYKELRDERFVSIAGAGDTGCWFTTVRKLYWLNAASRKSRFIAGEQIFSANLMDIKQAQGCLWVATDGNGMFVLKHGKLLAHFTTANSSLTGNTCHKILYERGRVWIATNNGISVFDAGTLRFIMSFITNDNLVNVDVKDLDVHDGRVYAATADGISIIDLQKFIREAKPPEVYVKQFMVGKVSYPLSASPVFTYINGIIRLRYTAITFQSPETVKYRYKIRDKDAGWSETSADVLEFYNLSPGSYELSLCAKKYNSDWSMPVSFPFTILPLWYQSKWFRILMACSLFLLVVLSAWLVVRSYKRKSDIQQRMLESEMKAIRLYMNPHFIFNSLSSLQVFIMKHQWQNAESYIPKFAKLIRQTMIYSGRQQISLAEEIAFLKTYIELEQSRFDQAFELQLCMAEGMDPAEIRLPPLVIQPIVENAIKYGLSGKGSGGILRISFSEDQDLIKVVVEDNGPGRRRVEEEQAMSPARSSSTGIRYTEERLKLLLKKRNISRPVVIEDLYHEESPCGTKVTLIIPIIHE